MALKTRTGICLTHRYRIKKLHFLVYGNTSQPTFDEDRFSIVILYLKNLGTGMGMGMNVLFNNEKPKKVAYSREGPIHMEL